MLRGYEERIKGGEISLGDLATSESDCSSARKKGDLYVVILFSPSLFPFRRLWCVVLVARTIC